MRRSWELILKYKLISIAIVTSIAAIIMISTSIYFLYKNLTKNHFHNTLSTVLNLSNEAIGSWADSEKSEALIWSQNAEIVNLTNSLVNAQLAKKHLATLPIHGKIRDLLAPVIKAKRYQGFFIVDVDGLNLSSMRNENIGLKNLLANDTSFFDQLNAGIPTISRPRKSDVPLPDIDGSHKSGLPTMFVGSPIRNTQNDIIAILLFRIDPKLDFSALLGRGRILHSGETYAFDKQANLISESRFNDELIELGLMSENDFSTLTISITDPEVNLRKTANSPKPRDQLKPTLMAASAIKGESSFNLDGYRDYRGVPVIGVWLWNEEVDIGITSEIDVSEAYANIYNMRFIIISAALVLIILLILMGKIFIRSQEDTEYIRKTKDRREIIDGILANISQGVAMFDADKKLLVWNDHYANILKASETQLSIGISSFELATLLAERGLLGKGTPSEMAKSRTDFLWATDSSRKDVTFADGRSYDVTTQKTPNAEMVISYTDITDRVKAEKASREQQRELKRLNQQKERLFSIVAHDLKNAFYTLLGFSDLLVNNYEQLDPKDIVEYARSINMSGRKLYEMMDNLLQWANSQMAGITLNQENLNLYELIEEELKVQRIIAREKKLTIDNKTNTDQYVFADSSLTRSVIRNLLNNAIKFTPENGRISIKVEDTNPLIKIYVQDSGIGMSQDLINDLFKSDEIKTSSGTGGETGTGLGTLICQSFVNLQGGEIQVEKSDDSGTLISFTLPKRQ